MKKLAHFIVKKPFSVSLLIVLQLAAIYAFVFVLSQAFEFIYYLHLVGSMILVIYILNLSDNPSYKLTWIIFILGIPLIGTITYLMFGGRKVPKRLSLGINELQPEQDPLLIQKPELFNEIRRAIDRRSVEYILRNTGYPLYKDSKVSYYPTGESKFEALKASIKRAEKFIFLEYFIIKEGKVWTSIFDLLKEKVKEGVEVRFMFDDAGAGTLPHDFIDNVRATGIQVVIFNPIRPVLAIRMNNRDHRKIAVIDGKEGYIGGTNLADEYINAITRFGHWKDVAIKIEGEAVYALTLMFLHFYDYTAKTKSDFKSYWVENPIYENEGFVQSYSDSPTDDEPVSENTHLNLINTASHYIYIMTPYLVIGYEMVQALCTAAKSGLDVRIMVPHIPDKKYVFSVTRSNYEKLTKDGVRIYEYLPGFVHGKVMVADDRIAIVGTSNLDFRSYYLHFECGALLIDSPCIADIVKDYQETLEKCEEITYEAAKNVPAIVKYYRAILNVFSGLL